MGPHFRSTHLELDEVVDAVRDYADTTAERMRALDAVPDGRTGTVAARTSLDAFPAGEVSVERAVAVIADILHTILEGLEKQRWMLTAALRHVS